MKAIAHHSVSDPRAGHLRAARGPPKATANEPRTQPLRTAAFSRGARREGRGTSRWGSRSYFQQPYRRCTRPAVSTYEDLFGRPEHRGHGIGKALLASLARIALDRGCGRVEWAFADLERASIGFYRSLGAKPMDDWTVYRLAVSPTHDPRRPGVAPNRGRSTHDWPRAGGLLPQEHSTRLKGYVPGEQPRERRVSSTLNTNENPYPPLAPPWPRRSSPRSTGGSVAIPDPLGNAFREAAATRHGVDPAMILAGNGSDDLLTIITRAFVGQGETVVYHRPSYILYRTLAELQDARWIEVPSSPTGPSTPVVRPARRPARLQRPTRTARRAPCLVRPAVALLAERLPLSPCRRRSLR